MFLKQATIFFCFIFILVSSEIKGAVIIGDPGYTNSSCTFNSRSFTVNITSTLGITSGSIAPKVYYKINSSSYTSAIGTLSSGNYKNGIWAFTMNYVLTSNDFIYLYVVAQDSSGSLTANPSTGFAGTDVNTIISNPNIPFSYYAGALNGVYTVGATSTIKRLTDAGVAYSTACFLGGPVTFVLTDTVYKPATGEYFPVVFSYRWDATPTNSLLIRPSTGNTAIIRSDTMASSVIKFANTRYFTLDGFNGTGNGITIYHDNKGYNPITAIYVAGKPPTALGCSDGAIRNTKVFGSSYINFGLYSPGIFVGEDAPMFPGGASHNNIDIRNNQLYRSVNGIDVFGNATNLLTRITGLTIASNTVGPNSIISPENIITNAGIQVSNATAPILNNNLVQNCIYAGMTCAAINSISVIENTVRCIGDSLFNKSAPVYGMDFLAGVTSAVVKGNQISNIKKFSTGNSSTGIFCANVLGIKIYNNMISDICSMGTTPNYNSWPVGITLDATGGAELANNTVSLFGSHSSTTGAMGSANLVIVGSYPASGPLTIWRNNIFNNTYDHSGSLNDTSYVVFVPISASSAPTYSFCDNNVYNVGGPGCPGVLAQQYYVNRKTISDMKIGFGGHVNSYTATPVFFTSNDLHLVTNANPAMDNTGVPITYISDDFDNQSRSSTYPDIGADEFTNGSPCISALYGNVLTTSLTACHGETVALNFGGPPSGTGYTYQWKVSPTTGGPYTNVIGGSGATTMSYTTGALSGGPTSYYFVLEKTCTSASLSAISNEATVTILPLPTASLSVIDTLLCPGESIFIFGSSNMSWNSATTYNWIGPGTFTSNAQNIGILPTWFSNSSSGTFYFTATYGACTSSIVSVSYSITPNYTSAISVTPSQTVCPGTTLTLVASGPSVSSYTWWPSGIQSATITDVPIALYQTYIVYSTDVNACSYTTTSYAYTYPDVGLTKNPVSGITCVGSGQSFTIAISSANTYTWNTGPVTTSIVVTPTNTTTYSVTGISNAGCSYTASTTLTVSTCTGIDEQSQESSVNIFPNPNNGNFILQIDEGIKGGELIIFNSLGQEVYKQTISEIRNEIKLEHIAVGLYYFKLKEKDGKNHQSKFIVH